MIQDSLKSFLTTAVLTAVAFDAFSFAWQPYIQSPNPSFDVTAAYAVENLTFLANGVDGPVITDVMPLWMDEDGNEIPARSGIQNPNGWDSSEFYYSFSISDFKANGEYSLVFPEGMIINAAGEKSDRLTWYYSFDVNELAPPMFEDFKVISISPDFSDPQAVWSDQSVSISTNHNDAIGLTTLQIFDLTTGESLAFSSNFTSGRSLGYSSPISWNVAGSYNFYEGHQYRADLVFYNGRDQYGPMGEPTPVVDRVSYLFTGQVEPYAYSPVSLLEVTPVPGTSLISTPEQAAFRYVFSGPVNIYRAETPMGSAGVQVYSQSCLSSNEDKTVWTLDLSKDDFMLSQSSTVVINVYVRDADGYQVQGNEGSDDNSCFQFEWECELGAIPLYIVSPSSGSSIDSLSEVVVQSVGGVKISWSWMESATIRRQDGEEIGRLYYDGGDASAQVGFSKWIPSGSSSPQPLDLSEEGSYVVSFPHGCFYAGSESDSKQSKGVSSSFCIGKGGDVPSYSDFTVLSVSPDFSKAQGKWSNQRIAFNTNHNEAVGLVTLVIQDQTSGERVLRSNNYSTGRIPGDSSEIYWNVSGSYQFLKGHEYSAEFVFYNGAGEVGGSPGNTPEIGRVSYRFVGSVGSEPDNPDKPDFKYSDLSLKSVEPTPASDVISSPDKAVFRYVFSGPVSVYSALTPVAGGSSVVYPESCLSSSADKTVWTLDLSGNDYVRSLDGALVICVYAKDANGDQLKGNYGDKEYSCYRFEWDCMLGALPVSVVHPAQNSVMETLTEVTVKSVDGLNMAWGGGPAVVLNADGKEIGRLGYVAAADVDAEDSIRFAWWIPAGSYELEPLCIEEKGDYTVSFSNGCFLVGKPAEARRSLAASSSFTVEGRVYSRLSLLGVSPEPMTDVISSPDKAIFRYSFSGPVVVDKVVTPLESGEVREYPASCLSSADDRTLWTLDLSADEYLLGLDGTLILSLYARDLDGYPLQGNFGEGDGSCFRYEWDCTLGKLPEAEEAFLFGSVDPAPESVLLSLSSIRITYPEPAVALVHNVNVYMDGIDAPVAEAGVEVDPEDSSVVCVTIDKSLMEAGIYTLAFPARAIGNVAFFDSDGMTGLFNPEFKLVYTVEQEDDAVDVLKVAIGHDVFDLNGRLVVRDADASALEKLAKGIYVCGRRKIIVR
ncbi:MAG: hypothetical protein K2H72_09105 [Muribaculaceae bacterium]|nr:hypothetical protein [Muribaculaceae bacterium]